MDDDGGDVNTNTEQNKLTQQNKKLEKSMVGMKFSLEDGVRSYYKTYARQMDFGVSKCSFRPRDDGS